MNELGAALERQVMRFSVTRQELVGTLIGPHQFQEGPRYDYIYEIIGIIRQRNNIIVQELDQPDGEILVVISVYNDTRTYGSTECINNLIAVDDNQYWTIDNNIRLTINDQEQINQIIKEWIKNICGYGQKWDEIETHTQPQLTTEDQVIINQTIQNYIQTGNPYPGPTKVEVITHQTRY